MQLTPEQVAHIAKLARLKLTPEETQKFSGQLTSILQYVEILNELDTSAVEPTTQVNDLKNRTRPDATEKFTHPTPDQLLDCSPNPVDMHQIRVHGTI